MLAMVNIKPIGGSKRERKLHRQAQYISRLRQMHAFYAMTPMVHDPSWDNKALTKLLFTASIHSPLYQALPRVIQVELRYEDRIYIPLPPHQELRLSDTAPQRRTRFDRTPKAKVRHAIDYEGKSVKFKVNKFKGTRRQTKK